MGQRPREEGAVADTGMRVPDLSVGRCLPPLPMHPWLGGVGGVGGVGETNYGLAHHTAGTAIFQNPRRGGGGVAYKDRGRLPPQRGLCTCNTTLLRANRQM